MPLHHTAKRAFTLLAATLVAAGALPSLAQAQANADKRPNAFTRQEAAGIQTEAQS